MKNLESIPLDTSGGHLNPDQTAQQEARKKTYESLTSGAPRPAKTAEVIRIPLAGAGLMNKFFEIRKYVAEFGADAAKKQFGQTPEDIRQDLVKRLQTEYLSNPRNPRTKASIQAHIDNLVRPALLETVWEAGPPENPDHAAHAYNLLLDRTTEYIKRMAENEMDKAA